MLSKILQTAIFCSLSICPEENHDNNDHIVTTVPEFHLCGFLSFFLSNYNICFLRLCVSCLSVPVEGREIKLKKKQKQKINRAEMQISKATSIEFHVHTKPKGLHCKDSAFSHLYVQKLFSFGNPSAWRQHNLCIINSAK